MNQAWDDQNTVIGAYRFLHNPSVALTELKEWLLGYCQQACEKSEHVLVLTDTSVIKLEHNTGRLKVCDPHIGPIDEKGRTGFILHVSMAVEAETGFVLGFPFVKAFNRHYEQPDRYERKYKKLPIAQKESFKWLEGCSEASTLLPEKQLTFVSDRESDIYEYFYHVQQAGADFVIRAYLNRPLIGQKQKLFEFLADQPCQGIYTFQVLANNRRKAREASIEVRYAPVQIKRPLLHMGECAEHLELFAIEAREKNPPEGEEPVHWQLLTTHRVEKLTEAIQIISWYQQRFLIEELFKVMKHKGLQLEDVQLGSGEAIKKLAYISLQVALAIMQMRMERGYRKKIPARIVFSNPQQAFMETLIKAKLEGKTQKQQNPYPKGSLAWAGWGIARLGGWKGYGPAAGVISLKRGLEAFFYLYQGWALANRFQNSA